MDDVNTFYALNPDVIFTYIDDEAVLMKSDGDEMYGVNPIGAEIWKKLEQGPMIKEELIKALYGIYDVKKNQLSQDVTVFINELLSEQFICEKISETNLSGAENARKSNIK